MCIQSAMALRKRFSALQLRAAHIFLVLSLAGILFRATRPSQQVVSYVTDLDEAVAVSGESRISFEEEYLERLAGTYKLGNETTWHAWRIQPSMDLRKTDSVTTVQAKFVPDSDAIKAIDLQNPIRGDLRVSKRMELPVPGPWQQGASDGADFLFGISTPYERVAARNWAMMHAWRRWLTNSKGKSNGAGLVLMLDNANEEQLTEVDEIMHGFGIAAYVTSTAETASKARRYYELIRVMKTYGATIAASGERKAWFGVIEDTIFFPSMSFLRQRLSSYDASQTWYLGLPSERSDWPQDGGSVTTYGGGAVLLTRSAVSTIPKLQCLRPEKGSPFRAQKWDVTLRDCVERHAGIKMHVIPAFYSPHDAEYKSQLAGHELGVRPLVLHDYEQRHGIETGKAHMVAGVCGEACFMHRYVFNDNWVLINGATISHHPDGLIDEPQKHGTHKHTHDDMFAPPSKASISGQLVTDDARVDRKPLRWNGRRSVWRLLDSAAGTDGSVWQAYLKRRADDGSDGSDADGLDSLIVLIWERGQRK